jgi:hypothetical protein
MPKSNILIGGLITVVVIIGGAYAFNSLNNNSNTKSTSPNSSLENTSETDKDVAIIDPNGEYKLFSDPSIVKQPEKNALFGNGQTITVEYDQSKGDAGSALFYKLYYVDKKGEVLQLTDSRFETKNGNVYSTSNKVFNSDADGLNGFMEVFIVTDAEISGGTATGNTVKLGMYPIKFETDKS